MRSQPGRIAAPPLAGVLIAVAEGARFAWSREEPLGTYAIDLAAMISPIRWPRPPTRRLLCRPPSPEPAARRGKRLHAPRGRGVPYATLMTSPSQLVTVLTVEATLCCGPRHSNPDPR